MQKNVMTKFFSVSFFKPRNNNIFNLIKLIFIKKRLIFYKITCSFSNQIDLLLYFAQLYFLGILYGELSLLSKKLINLFYSILTIYRLNCL